MKEIETKVLEINAQAIIKKLEALGAKKILDNVFIEDITFDFADNTLTKKHELLRLRRLGNKTFLAYKKRGLVHTPIRTDDESELEITNAETMKEILLHLGFRIKKRRQKQRTSYLYQDVRIEIDSYPDIPKYLELEAPSEKKIKFIWIS